MEKNGPSSYWDQPRRLGAALTRYRFLTIPLLSLLVFWPALDNGFISDDFIFLDRVESWTDDPLYLFTIPPENFRSTTYLSFLVLKRLFGYHAAPFYLFTILLHGVNAVLLGRLVRKLTGDPMMEGLTSLLFVALQNPQEAVMWLGGMHENLLGFLTLVTLNLWLSRKFLWSTLSYCLALFTKESAPVALPLVLSLDRWIERRPVYRQFAYLIVPTIPFALLFLSLADRNSLVSGGFYAVDAGAILVLLKSLNSLAFPWVYLAAVMVAAVGQRLPFKPLGWSLVWMACGLSPYIFLTYQDHVPSRHEYLAGMGAAMAVAFCLREIGRRTTVSLFLALFVGLNAGYIYGRKDAQFEERAAPTSHLIRQLHRRTPERILIQNFPLNPWIAKMTTHAVPGWSPDLVLLDPETCDNCPKLRWDAEHQTYSPAFE